MTVDLDAIKRLAMLARIDLDDAHASRLLDDVREVLAHAASLPELEPAHEVDPTPRSALRTDDPGEPLGRRAVLANASPGAHDGEHFVVPNVVGSTGAEDP